MFQFRAFPTYTYLIQCTLSEYCSDGFPHSEISGSKLMCSSPKLIAACHVLHRLLMPRHSPCALSSLTNRKQLLLFSLWIMQASNRFLVWNCNCYPLLKSSTIKMFSLFCLSVALLFFFMFPLFSFQGASFQPLLKPDLKIQSFD